MVANIRFSSSTLASVIVFLGQLMEVASSSNLLPVMPVLCTAWLAMERSNTGGFLLKTFLEIESRRTVVFLAGNLPSGDFNAVRARSWHVCLVACQSSWQSPVPYPPRPVLNGNSQWCTQVVWTCVSQSLSPNLIAWQLDGAGVVYNNDPSCCGPPCR